MNENGRNEGMHSIVGFNKKMLRLACDTEESISV
jgi:hypothetical protein